MKEALTYKPLIYDISTWEGDEFTSTLGTRNKMVYERPDGQYFFFKESFKNYPWEFWSEIIASKIGQAISAKVVDYNIAYYSNGLEGFNAGCICEFVHNPKNEALIHGLELLIVEKPEFDKVKGKDHSFQLIEKVLSKYPFFKPYIENIVEAIVFDSLIGNRDRHQENWAIIMDVRSIAKYARIPKPFRIILAPVALFSSMILNYLFGKNPLDMFRFRFSPLFDNGSSLGREILEENLIHYIDGPNSEDRINRYAFGKKYQSHIRWEDTQIGHFELIKRIKEIHPKYVTRYLNKFVTNYKSELISSIIYNIDKEFELIDPSHCLSRERKDFIIRLLNLRYQELKRLL